MNFRELQEHSKELIESQGWEDRSPERRLTFAVQELGEISKEVLGLIYHQDEEEEKLNARRLALGMEIYDLIWNLCDLANLMNVDLQEAAEKKMQINRSRSWR